MLNVLTFKVPDPLAKQLNDVAEQLGSSKGAILRHALEQYLKKSATLMQERINEVTRQMVKGRIKHKKLKTDWSEIRRLSEAPEGLDPIEEVLCLRRRGL